MSSTPYDVDDLLEELRDMAASAASFMNEGNRPLGKVIAVPTCVPEETTEWEAAEVIVHYRDALKRIAAGEDPASGIAESALDFEPPASRLINGQQF
ncbi:hypothetical protein OSH11_11735 [Kaistia dalseonensis]|uniref:Uncharacterized protein n=1 Tax=Kaistia dalseonensis TaxID=410840 RepID=A0ABU0H7V0_9HYPH|nr:hypothetical protein [Kaistia dalseonensis]MCX5495381.1 hypothetical protein [Kaistia dalseonensis]MDQ0437968.1 hypothetical protein [Kaistia dalseonensis]